MNRKLIAAIVVLVAAVLGLHFWAEWEKARFDALLPQQPAVEEQQVIEDTVDDVAEDTVEDTTGGHWHGDEWHAEPHRDALLDEGMHFADVQNPVGAPVTDNPELQESLTPDYVLPPGTSREDARRVREAYKKWHREVWQPAHDEWWQLAQQTTKIFSFKDEDFMRKVDNMSDEERAELAAKVHAHDEKSMAAYEQLQVIERNKPDFVAEVLGGK